MGIDNQNNISFTLLQNIKKRWRYIGFFKKLPYKILRKNEKG